MRSAAWLAALLLVGAGGASAEVTLPDGTLVPLDSMNGEEQLFELFAGRMETGLDFGDNALKSAGRASASCHRSSLRTAG